MIIMNGGLGLNIIDVPSFSIIFKSRKYQMKKIIIALAFIMGATTFLPAQKKYEHEERIDKAEAPKSMQDFIDQCGFNKKIKWYKEYQKKTYSYEAKTQYNGYDYSIEFDSVGAIEDVERVVPIKHLSNDEQIRISDQLEGRLRKYKIIRIQEQFVGSPDLLHQLITTDAVAERVVRNLEINVKGIFKDKSNWSYFEFLYNDIDGIVKMEELELRPTYNLEF